MNVKKTKKFKENRPENCHVHDSRWLAVVDLSMLLLVLIVLMDGVGWRVWGG